MSTLANRRARLFARLATILEPVDPAMAARHRILARRWAEVA